MRQRKSRRRGISMLWTTIMLIALIGLLGLSVDVGYVMLTKHQLQNGADAAALAGAIYVHQSHAAARDAAMEVGTANAAARVSLNLDRNDDNTPSGDIVLGKFIHGSRIFIPTLEDSDAVKVVTRRTNAWNGPLSLFFGSVFGVDAVQMTATAIAMSSQGIGPALLILDPTGSQAMYVNGGGMQAIQGGFIHINSSSATAMVVGNNFDISTTHGVHIVGCASSATLANVDGPVYCNVPHLPDPLASMPEPAQPANIESNPPGNIRHYRPGYYPNGIDISNNVVATFDPGIYYISTQASNPNSTCFKVTGGTILADPPEGVLFFIKRGSVSISGSADLIKMRPMSDGPYKDVSIFQSRTNYANADIRGGSPTRIEGTMYFPGNLEQTNGPTVNLRGNGVGFAVRIIAWRIRQTGGVPLSVFYQTPYTPTNVYLVQ